MIVTPVTAAAQGFIIPLPDNPPVPHDYLGPADTAGGDSSLKVGPIPAQPRQAKFELEPPERKFSVADFGGLSYQYQILAPVASGDSSDFVYVNVYVDAVANGIGFFGSVATSSGFYDCRYTYIATSDAPGWNTASFGQATTPDQFASRHVSCGSTLGGSVGQIQFFRLNGGDTGPSSPSGNTLPGADAGLTVAYDLLSVTIGGSTTTYNFEVDGDGDGTPDTAPPANKDACKKDGWKSFNNPSFKNQGQCVSWVNHNT